MKALGKKPPEPDFDYENRIDDVHCVMEHYRQALIETADELEKWRGKYYDIPALGKCTSIYMIEFDSIIKKARISAGVK